MDTIIGEDVDPSNYLVVSIQMHHREKTRVGEFGRILGEPIILYYKIEGNTEFRNMKCDSLIQWIEKWAHGE